MDVRDHIRYWNVEPADRGRGFACDAQVGEPRLTLLRAIDIDAPTPTVYRWMCQLSQAPYSYDWIDNLGRPSPRTLTPGAEQITPGQRMLTGRVVDVVEGEQFTVAGSRRANLLFGEHAMTYAVEPLPGGRSRLFGAICVATPSTVHRARAWALGLGDRVMMRRQLLTLKERAETTAARAGR